MSDAAAATPSSTMKLLDDRASQRVLFAEAGKDVVDFLFGLLAMPVGAVASMIAGAADVLGSVPNVYASVEKMDAAYMQSAEARDALLVNDNLPAGNSTRLLPTTTAATTSAACAAATAASAMAPCYSPYGWPPAASMPPAAYLLYSHTAPAAPRAPESGGGAVDLLPPPDAGLALLPPSLYRCHACYALGSPQGSRGFVQGAASYTVMDDLTVTPASNVSTVALLGRLGVKDLDALEERTVTVGRKECLEILKVSLQSKTVLTDVFLPKTKNPPVMDPTPMDSCGDGLTSIGGLSGPVGGSVCLESLDPSEKDGDHIKKVVVPPGFSSNHHPITIPN